MFSFGYSFFLSGPIIGYTSLSYFYIFSIVFYMIHYFDTIAKHPFLVALQMHPYQCSSLQYPPRIDKPAPSLIHHTLKRCLDVYAESRVSRFFVGIIFYLREVLLTSRYEKRLFEHASQPCVAGTDIRLLPHLRSRTNLSRDSYPFG